MSVFIVSDPTLEFIKIDKVSCNTNAYRIVIFPIWFTKSLSPHHSPHMLLRCFHSVFAPCPFAEPNSSAIRRYSHCGLTLSARIAFVFAVVRQIKTTPKCRNVIYKLRILSSQSPINTNSISKNLSLAFLSPPNRSWSSGCSMSLR